MFNQLFCDFIVEIKMFNHHHHLYPGEDQILVCFFLPRKALKRENFKRGQKRKKGTASVCEAKAYLLDLT